MQDGPQLHKPGPCPLYSRLRRAIVPAFCAALFLLLAFVPLWRSQALAEPSERFPARATALAPGDLLPRIQCPPGYTARIYAQGLRSPDGLAFHPDGSLYVAEERAGRVSRIDPAGEVTTVWTGLSSPEGIAFDDAGNLYVVEDVPSGRLIQRAADGTTTTLAAGLEAPEGVAWGPDGALYVTESSIEFATRPQDLRSRITRVSFSGEVTRILTDTPVLEGTRVMFNSYAGIVAGPGDRLYVTNELSGVEVTQTVVLIPGEPTTTLTLSTTDSVFAVDPVAGTRTLLAGGLIAPEGLRFAPGNTAAPRFPLYVAEEDTGDGRGRLSVVGPDGSPSTLCTGFLSIEDVVLDGQGRLYVSEDGRDGLVIRIEPPRTAPRTVELDGPATALIGQNATFSAAVRPITTTQPITYTWSATGNDPQTIRAGLSVTVTFAWDTPGLQQVAVRAANAEGAVTATHTLTVYASPVADFVGTPARGLAPLTVAFANRSSGDTASLWDFGDGLSSTAHSPTHTYRAAGAYTVTLTVSGPGGSDAKTRPAYITALTGLYLPLVLRLG